MAHCAQPTGSREGGLFGRGALNGQQQFRGLAVFLLSLYPPWSMWPSVATAGADFGSLHHGCGM